MTQLEARPTEPVARRPSATACPVWHAMASSDKAGLSAVGRASKPECRWYDGMVGRVRG
ncbi:hypothetical protein HZU77_002330 [Neisseriaceae bacterium TC5R-5]|nr:hypothetical protein [Neisseriaceae bacterium TC5R-5]